MILAGSGKGALASLLGAVAVFASMTNVVSGFLITDRMLKMFHRRDAQTRQRVRRPQETAP